MTNGEKFRSTEERFLAFREFCKDRACESCPCEGRIYGSDFKCMLEWLNLEAEEVILFPCPFCGGEAKFNKTLVEGSTRGWVQCINCGVNFLSQEKDKVIAAWNRRVNTKTKALAKRIELARINDEQRHRRDVADVRRLTEEMALKIASRTLRRWREDLPMSAWDEVDTALIKIKSAIAEPIRNCDLYTVGESLRRYGFPTKSKPWGEKEWLAFCEWLISEAKGEAK